MRHDTVADTNHDSYGDALAYLDAHTHPDADVDRNADSNANSHRHDNSNGFAHTH